VEFSQIALGAALLVVVGLPVLAVRGGVPDDQADEVAQARRAVYASAAFSLVLLSALAFAVSLWQGISPARLGWQVQAPGPAFLWALVVAVVGLGAAWLISSLGERLGWEESPISHALMPQGSGEIRSFLVMVGIAAIGEEYLFRGFAYQILAEPLGAWPAVLLTSASFGLSHGYQRAIGVIRASFLGFLLALPVLWTGSLFPSVVAHFWINAAIGIGGWRLLFGAEEQKETSE
jgi:membrane protease YdiL (CAAX protease family)